MPNIPNDLSSLCTFLASETSYKFALWAWAHGPSGDYGVVTQDQDSTFFAEGNAERAQRGYVDYFTHSDGFVAKSTIEAALAKSGWHWSHQSVQFEIENGIVHHEWVVAWLG